MKVAAALDLVIGQAFRALHLSCMHVNLKSCATSCSHFYSCTAIITAHHCHTPPYLSCQILSAASKDQSQGGDVYRHNKSLHNAIALLKLSLKQLELIQQ